RVMPGALVGVTRDFMMGGPYAEWRGSEIVFQALSGVMHYNGKAGEKPLYGAGRRASFGAGLLLYTRILAELYAQARGLGRADIIRVATHEVAASMEQYFSTQWAYSRTLAERGEPFRPIGRVKCRDGWVVFFAVPERRQELL